MSFLSSILVFASGCFYISGDEADDRLGKIPTEDTAPAVEQDAPLCSEAWGWVDTELSLQQDGKVLTVVAPSDAFMMYSFEGQADLCDQNCSADWLDEMSITDTKARETEFPLPLRMDKGDLYYAYFRMQVPEKAAGTTEHCFVDTSAGKYWLEIRIGG